MVVAWSNCSRTGGVERRSNRSQIVVVTAAWWIYATFVHEINYYSSARMNSANWRVNQMLNRTRHTRGELCTQTGMQHCRADRWTRLRFCTAPISKSLRSRAFRICVRIRYGILRCSCVWTAWLKRIDPYRNVCRFSVTWHTDRRVICSVPRFLIGLGLSLRTPFSF